MGRILVNLRGAYSTGLLDPALDICLLGFPEITAGRDYEGSERVFHLEGTWCVGSRPFYGLSMNEGGVEDED